VYIKPVSGREVLRNLLRLLLVGVVISTGMFFILRQAALQGVVVAERQLAQQDEEAREAAWEQIKAYEAEFVQLATLETEAVSVQAKKEVRQRHKHIARLYKHLWERESRWGNPRLCGEFPVPMQIQTKPTP
jgi:hypothetical protein